MHKNLFSRPFRTTHVGRFAAPFAPLTLTLLVVLGSNSAGSTASAQVNESLVPAVFNYQTDSQGFRWDVSSYGQIGSGTNSAFSGASTLTVNRSSFRPTTRMMKADRSEYVLTARIGNLQVTRRVKINLPASAVRYVEIIKNNGSTPQNVTLSMRTQMVRGPALGVVSNNGQAVSSRLGKKDSGVIVVGQPTNAQTTLVYHLAGSGSKIKPSITNQANQQILFNYTVSVPAGKTVSILHGLAQRRATGMPTSKVAKELFKPFNARNWTRDLPAEIRRSIVNLDKRAFSDAGSMVNIEALRIEREAADVLAIGDETRLKGTASCKGFELTTQYGPLNVPLEKVAAIAGPRFTGGLTRVFLIDGQVFNGELKIEDLRFVLNHGLKFDVELDNLDRLLIRVSPNDGVPGEGVTAILETTTGDRIALKKSPDQVIGTTTPWGERQIALDEVERMFLSEQKVGHQLLLRDGSRLFGFISDSSLTVETLHFGQKEFVPAQIHRLTAAHASYDEDEEPSVVAPHLLLAGENVMVGQLDLPALHFITAGNKIPVPPNQIRLLRNVSEAKSDDYSSDEFFEAELWDGGTVRGALAESVLPVRTANRVAQVPIRDILEVHVPTPVVTDTMMQKIVALIQDLGHAKYEKRKAAKDALGELGHLPKTQLNETLRQTSDPEVRRSVESLLAELEE